MSRQWLRIGNFPKFLRGSIPTLVAVVHRAAQQVYRHDGRECDEATQQPVLDQVLSRLFDQPLMKVPPHDEIHTLQKECFVPPTTSAGGTKLQGYGITATAAAASSTSVATATSQSSSAVPRVSAPK